MAATGDRNARWREGFCRFCAGAVLVLFALPSLYLAVMSLLATSDLSTGSGRDEIIRFLPDRLGVNLIALGLCLAALYLFWRICGRIRLRTLTALLLCWTLLAGAAFVTQAKIIQAQDAEVVSFWAMQAARGDTSYYHAYFHYFPFQFGLALYEELFFRLIFALRPGIPEGFAALLLQGLNLLWLCAAELAMIRCAGLLFSSERAQKLTALLLFLAPQGLFTTTYLYGNIPGLGCAMLALWAFLLFRKNGRPLPALLCALFIACAVILKQNYLIYFVALAIVWLLCLLRKFSLRSALGLLLCAALVLGLRGVPQRLYEKRIGEDFGGGIPIWSWMAMGFREGSTCSGWYDPTYTTILFENSDYDRETVARKAKQAALDRIEEFRRAPGEAAAFFNRKFLSQWNEPSCQSVWTNKVREHYSPPGRLYTKLLEDGEGALKGYMGFVQQLVLFGAAAAVLVLLRRRDIVQCLLPLILLGGVLYHLLFEAKAQYALNYFLTAIPLAACGLDALFGMPGDKQKNQKPRT